jgi:hypothetical protein
MTSPYAITVRPGHPSFLDLEWDRPLPEWTSDRLLNLPKGISRHDLSARAKPGAPEIRPGDKRALADSARATMWVPHKA